MRPSNLNTKIFLDSGDPTETQQALSMLGFLDGQTTNPSLIAKKNPQAREMLENGERLSIEALYQFYRDVIGQIESIIPNGSISIEVYADKSSRADYLLEQGRKMFTWARNAYIKYPTTAAGLEAAEISVNEGMRVNMTLVFTQEQAAAVYSATMGAPRGSVYVSPFIGRLDDKGENGMDLIQNIQKMYGNGDGHVDTLVASVRNMDHFMQSLKLKAPIITAPFSILKEWSDAGRPMPDDEYAYESKGSAIEYRELNLSQEWRSFDIAHELTDVGLRKFADDWNALIG